jgi:hypothetical protein
MSTDNESINVKNVTDITNTTKIMNNTIDVALDKFDMAKKDSDALKEMISKNMANYISKGQITDFNIGEMITTKHTWTSIYPNIFDRILAFLFFKVTRRTIYYEPRWFHMIFPFDIGYRHMPFEDFYNVEFKPKDGATEKENFHAAMQEYDDSCWGTPSYDAQLHIPHNTRELEIKLVPVKSIDTIDLKINVEPTKEDVK